MAKAYANGNARGGRGMNLGRRLAVLAACLCVLSAARAAQTVTYSYDVFGRLGQVGISGGPGNGVVRTYEYDAAGNRKRYRLTGAAADATVAIAPTSAVANTIAAGVAISVNVSGGSPTGMVTFTEGGVFIGSAMVLDGQASIFLEGFPLGMHTITAAYSGDAVHDPHT